MNNACRAANLSSLLKDPGMPSELKGLWPAFQKAFQSDRRGTRLNDSLAFAPCGGVNVVVANAKLTGRQALQHRSLLPLALEHIASQSSEGLLYNLSLRDIKQLCRYCLV